MEDHRGKIFFKSEKGKGTEVRLCFPLTDRDAAPVPLEPPGIAVRCG
jgi:signal transduction histidine kinase